MAKVKIKPLADRVLVEPQAAEQVTAGGIIIPDTAQEKPQRGVVVAVGSGTINDLCKLAAARQNKSCAVFSLMSLSGKLLRREVST